MAQESKFNPVPLIAIATLAVVLFVMRSNPNVKNFADGELPPISGTGGTWLNSDHPLSWESLGGKVVWLEFSFIH